jgi:hypothetical protein
MAAIEKRNRKCASLYFEVPHDSGVARRNPEFWETTLRERRRQE